MASKWGLVDNSFPTFREDEKLEDRVAKLADYLYILTEELKYQLGSVTQPNQNPTAYLNGRVSLTSTGLRNEMAGLRVEIAGLVVKLAELEAVAAQLQDEEGSA